MVKGLGLESWGVVKMEKTFHTQHFAMLCKFILGYVQYKYTILPKVFGNLSDSHRNFMAFQLQLLWEGCPQILGMCFWDFLTILPEAYLCQTALRLHYNSSQRCSKRLMSGLCCQVHPHQHPPPCLYWPGFVTGAHSCYKKGSSYPTILKLFTNVGSMTWPNLLVLLSKNKPTP